MLIKVFRNALIAGIIMVLLVPGISCSKKIDITRVTLPFIGGPAIELKVRDFDAKGQSVNIIKDIPVSHAALILIDVWAGKPHTEDNISTKILPLINAARERQILIVHSLNGGQINEKIDRGENGAIIRSSIMLNVREDSIEEASKLYKELRATLDQSVPEKAVKKKEESNAPKCQKCGKDMVLRQNKKKGNFFWGCNFPICQATLPYLEENQKEEVLETIQA